MPELEALRQELEPQGLGFLALSLEQNPERVRRAVQEWNLQFQVATATGPVLGPLFVRDVPSTVFVDANGKILVAASGPKSKAFLEKHARKLLTAH